MRERRETCDRIHVEAVWSSCTCVCMCVRVRVKEMARASIERAAARVFGNEEGREESDAASRSGYGMSSCVVSCFSGRYKS